jgi:hypothetical protein
MGRNAAERKAEARRRKAMTMKNEQDSKPPVTPPLPPATGSADSWRLHILGPDDLIPMESELHALREANMLNIGMARVRLKRPNDPNMPWCMAVVERNGVEYSNDQYPPNAPGERPATGDTR